MILVCQKGYPYGNVARIPAKQAKDLDLDPKSYHGGPIQSFETGKEYDIERGLALRLLRDYGPKRGRAEVRWLPKNPMDYIDALQGSGQAEKVTLGEAMERGFVTPEGGGTEQTVDIEPAGVA